MSVEPRIAASVGTAVNSRSPISQQIQSAMERAVHQGIQEGLELDSAEMKDRIQAARQSEYTKQNEMRQFARQRAESSANGDPLIAKAMDHAMHECIKQGLVDEESMVSLIIAAGESEGRLLKSDPDRRRRMMEALSQEG